MTTTTTAPAHGHPLLPPLGGGREGGPRSKGPPRPRGFTLIELLVVLAIVSTLLMIVAPRYFGQLDAAREAVLRDNLRGTRAVIDQFHADQGRYPESLQELVDKRYLRSLPVDPITGSDSGWEIVPVPQGYGGTVYDLHSGAPGQGRDGRPYAQW